MPIPILDLGHPEYVTGPPQDHSDPNALAAIAVEPTTTAAGARVMLTVTAQSQVSWATGVIMKPAGDPGNRGYWLNLGPTNVDAEPDSYGPTEEWRILDYAYSGRHVTFRLRVPAQAVSGRYVVTLEVHRRTDPTAEYARTTLTVA
jgi:hypothetical protein